MAEAPCRIAEIQIGMGQLYQGDCLEWLPTLADESVDLVFADPPFNLNKDYGAGVSDRLKDTAYLDWCAAWIKEVAEAYDVVGDTAKRLNRPPPVARF